MTKCRILCCNNNQLKQLPDLPVCEVLECHNNQLIKLTDLPNCKIVYCQYNHINELSELPNCEILYCYNNELTKLPKLSKCRILYCHNNQLNSLSYHQELTFITPYLDQWLNILSQFKDNNVLPVKREYKSVSKSYYLTDTIVKWAKIFTVWERISDNLKLITIIIAKNGWTTTEIY